MRIWHACPADATSESPDAMNTMGSTSTECAGTHGTHTTHSTHKTHAHITSTSSHPSNGLTADAASVSSSASSSGSNSSTSSSTVEQPTQVGRDAATCVTAGSAPAGVYSGVGGVSGAASSGPTGGAGAPGAGTNMTANSGVSAPATHVQPAPHQWIFPIDSIKGVSIYKRDRRALFLYISQYSDDFYCFFANVALCKWYAKHFLSFSPSFHITFVPISRINSSMEFTLPLETCYIFTK